MMEELSANFEHLYDEAVGEEMDDGDYKAVNTENVLLWHEYRAGTFYPVYISLIDMLSRMATLTSTAASQGLDAPEELLTLYRNGVTEALDSFNKTVQIYSDEQVTRIYQEKSLLFVLILSMFVIITVFLILISFVIFLSLNKFRRKFWNDMFDRVQASSNRIRVT
jgi:hypothetical protein